MPPTPGTILVVDDVLANLSVLATILESQGYEVRQATSGRLALSAIASDPPDLILLDLMMPEMDGFTVCQQLQATPQYQEIPVICITALDEVTDKVRAFACGAVDYIVKPFQAEEVLARVQSHLTLRHLRQALQEANTQLRQWNQELEQRVAARTQALSRLLHTDTLTGLLSRHALCGQLESLLLGEQAFALCILDCDQFSLVNHSLGYGRGDELLCLLSQRLLAQLGEQDVLARLGEDDFALVLVGEYGHDALLDWVERLHQRVRVPFQLGEYELYLSATSGLVLRQPYHQRALELIREADTALQRAKREHRGGSYLFDLQLTQMAQKRLDLEGDLRRGLQQHQFQVYYQPIVDIRTGQIVGVEALTYWHHPQRGLVGPGEFIACAEDTGVIIPLGLQTLECACLQMQEWPSDWWLSVNLSPRQFAYPFLGRDIDLILQRTGFPAQRLHLELTEGALGENVPVVADTLRQLRGRQICLCVDDFGTGYSCLRYLQEFPIHNIKIDRSFVASIAEAGSGGEIAKIIAHLGYSLNLTVTAEGIETAYQQEFLRQLGCPYGQGFYFARPQPPSGIDRLVHAGGCLPTKPGHSAATWPV
ncbi:putative diguanylate cyclase/phosphodiesterase [Gloeomargarita lithophora Alchichica-D10]|uniref:Putative diguanylate cyclase/phosphodiesterase n=1 Tax=Gloeomargarita lithophora Alchichica-D10 TaxID=1188229 RepID=A0A1J0AA70_9CYAN|nr:EAL domain-containing response regulator [Gloeomargarita lithophora]APB32840.1 putative diguanylate cyclase/phosphodiesterase [Gloeomargarita lithophora Alchichica-D10]